MLTLFLGIMTANVDNTCDFHKTLWETNNCCAEGSEETIANELPCEIQRQCRPPIVEQSQLTIKTYVDNIRTQVVYMTLTTSYLAPRKGNAIRCTSNNIVSYEGILKGGVTIGWGNPQIDGFSKNTVWYVESTTHWIYHPTERRGNVRDMKLRGECKLYSQNTVIQTLSNQVITHIHYTESLFRVFSGLYTDERPATSLTIACEDEVSQYCSNANKESIEFDVSFYAGSKGWYPGPSGSNIFAAPLELDLLNAPIYDHAYVFKMGTLLKFSNALDEKWETTEFKIKWWTMTYSRYVNVINLNNITTVITVLHPFLMNINAHTANLPLQNLDGGFADHIDVFESQSNTTTKLYMNAKGLNTNEYCQYKLFGKCATAVNVDPVRDIIVLQFETLDVGTVLDEVIRPVEIGQPIWDNYGSPGRVIHTDTAQFFTSFTNLDSGTLFIAMNGQTCSPSVAGLAVAAGYYQSGELAGNSMIGITNTLARLGDSIMEATELRIDENAKTLRDAIMTVFPRYISSPFLSLTQAGLLGQLNFAMKIEQHVSTVSDYAPTFLDLFANRRSNTCLERLDIHGKSGMARHKTYNVYDMNGTYGVVAFTDTGIYVDGIYSMPHGCALVDAVLTPPGQMCQSCYPTPEITQKKCSGEWYADEQEGYSCCLTRSPNATQCAQSREKIKSLTLNRWCIIDRGGCNFPDKTMIGQWYGCKALIINSPISMGSYEMYMDMLLNSCANLLPLVFGIPNYKKYISNNYLTPTCIPSNAAKMISIFGAYLDPNSIESLTLFKTPLIEKIQSEISNECLSIRQIVSNEAPFLNSQLYTPTKIKVCCDHYDTETDPYCFPEEIETGTHPSICSSLYADPTYLLSSSFTTEVPIMSAKLAML